MNKKCRILGRHSIIRKIHLENIVFLSIPDKLFHNSFLMPKWKLWDIYFHKMGVNFYGGQKRQRFKNKRQEGTIFKIKLQAELAAFWKTLCWYFWISDSVILTELFYFFYNYNKVILSLMFKYTSLDRFMRGTIRWYIKIFNFLK